MYVQFASYIQGAYLKFVKHTKIFTSVTIYSNRLDHLANMLPKSCLLFWKYCKTLRETSDLSAELLIKLINQNIFLSL